MDELNEKLTAGYRRAILLTGQRGYAADALVAACVSFPDASRAAAARFEARLAATCRPRRGRTPDDVFGGIAGDLWRAAATLPPTDFDLWVLARVEGYDDRRLSLVFELPREFISAGVRAADERLRGAVGAAMDDAVPALRAAAMNADASAAVARATGAMRRARQRRRARAAVMIGGFIIVLAFAGYAMLDLMAWKGGGEPREAAAPTDSALSVPMPAGSSGK